MDRNFRVGTLGPCYDTPGLFGWSVADAIGAYEAIAEVAVAAPTAPDVVLNICVLEDEHLGDATADVLAALRLLRKRLIDAGANVESRRAPIDFKRLAAVQRTTMMYEASRAMAGMMQLPSGQIGAKLLEMLREGQAISEQRYLTERREIDRLRRSLLAATTDVDAFLWPATPAPAPKGLNWTGDPKYIGPWTAIGGPIVTVPSGFSDDGLPLGCNVIGKPGGDQALVALAKRYLV